MNLTTLWYRMPLLRLPKTWLLAMKLTIILLLAVILSASARTFGQHVTLNVRNASLKSVLTSLRQQTGYDFVADENLLNEASTLTVNLKNAQLNAALEKIFEDMQLTYELQNKVIVIRQKELSVFDRLKAILARIDINGNVIDETGRPLPGATIKLKDGSQATVTDVKGQFMLKGVDDKATLIISSIGYATREVLVKSDLHNIRMEVSNSKLDEIQVIAYGTTTKRANTGDVSTIDSKTLQQYPSTNALDALQGTVPGLNVYKNTGNANSSYKVQIRGINGLSGAQPLYVVDGILYGGGSLYTNNLNLGTGTANGADFQGYSAIGFINPDDIETISVLKDADATAIYGSRGADGVILITTKKGKAGATRIDASVYSGVTDIAHLVPFLNTTQYLQMRREAKANDKTAIGATEYDINGAWDTTRNTNWTKYFLGGYGHNTKAQISASGGNEQIQYRISGGYNRATSLENLNGSDQTANLNLSLSSTSQNKKFSIAFTGGYLYDISTITPTDFISGITLAPNAPALYTTGGALNYQNNTFNNPLGSLNYINRTPTTNLTSSLILSYKIISNLEFKLTSGYNRQTLNEFLGTPTTVYPPYQTATSSSTFTTDNAFAWSIEPQLNYNKQFGQGKLLATVGASLQNQNSTTQSLIGTGYSSDLLLSSLTAATSITVNSQYSVSPRKFSALFGRVNYNWADKYYIDITGRNDGSSTFGQNRQYHLFAAVGAGWIFSEEQFVKNNLSFLSFGKLRGSYGSTGRDNIPPFSYLSTYNGINNTVAYGNLPGVIPTGLANADLSWETTKKAELALELQFLNGRIAFETNFYRNRTTGTLGTSLLSYVTGFNGYYANMPATVQNQGFDVTLTTTNIKGKSFSWSTTLLFTRDRNKLLDYPGLKTSTYANIYVVGQPVNIVKAYNFAGVNAQTGSYQFYTASGSITGAPNSVTDKTALINVNPDFYGSVQNNITYKQFRLSFLFRFMKQNGRNEFWAMNIISPGASLRNFPTLVLNRWQKPGDVTNIQKFTASGTTSQNYARSSNFAYGDASYGRLQNLSFSYTFSQAALHKLGLQNLQLFLQGDNLWTITGYNGFDPENQSNTSLPPLRIMTAGLRLTL